MGVKEQIHALLPDNIIRLISEKDLRDAFDLVVDSISGSIENYPTLADFPSPGDIATIYKALDSDELYVWDSETATYILSSIDEVWKNAVDQGIASALTTLQGVLDELADIEIVKANKDASEMSPANILSWQEALDINVLVDNYNDLLELLAAEVTNRQNADIAEANARTFTDGLLDGKITTKLTKPVAPDNIAERVINADGSTSPKGNFSRTLQVEVSANTTASEDWKGKLILITASCTITIPAALSDSWGIEVATLAGVTLTLAITTPKTWLFGTPSTIGEKSVLTIAQRGNTNSIALFGL